MSAGRLTRSTLPTTHELTAWRRFLHAHARIVRRLEADLVAEQRLPLASYDVLVQLVEAPQHRLRMTELADAVLLSRSGLTRLVDRLVQEGLVTREICPSDLRGSYAVLTDAGYARLRAASPTHLRGVGEYVGRLSGPELDTFAALLAKLLGEDAQDAPETELAEPSPAADRGVTGEAPNGKRAQNGERAEHAARARNGARRTAGAAPRSS